MMLDIDDFKLNDVFGHAVGDEVLTRIGDLRAAVRGTDVVCRIGGEEFAVIVPAARSGHAVAVASRLADRVKEVEVELAGTIAVSVGIAQGPEHAANPRELVACAEAAMMTAKARGKNQVVYFDESATERPQAGDAYEDVRSIAHLKMLQSLAGKLNRSNDVHELGMAIANELRLLIDYHNCRIFVRDGEELTPIAFQGELTATGRSAAEVLRTRVGEGSRAASSRPARRSSSATPPSASSRSRSRAPPRSRSRSSPCRSTARASSARSSSPSSASTSSTRTTCGCSRCSPATRPRRSRTPASTRRAAARPRAPRRCSFGRDLAATEGLERVLERVVEGAAQLLGAPHASLWLQERSDSSSSCAPPRARRCRSAIARPWPCSTSATRSSSPTPRRWSPRSRSTAAAARSPSVIVAVRGRRPQLELLGGFQHQAKLAIASASVAEPRAHLPLHRRGARERARGAGRVHLLARALDHGHLLRVGRELGLDGDALKRLGSARSSTTSARSGSRTRSCSSPSR